MAETMTYDPGTDSVTMGDNLTPDEQESLQVGETLQQEQEGLLAGKYKNAEELEKAYGELERKLGEQGNKDSETVDEAEVQESDEVSEEKKETSEDSAVTTLLNEANKEYYDNDQSLSKETIDKFAEMSSTELVSAYLESLKGAQAQQQTQAAPELTDKDINVVKNSAGGEAEYGKIIEWARESYEQSDIDSFNNLESDVDPLYKPGSVNINADELGILGGISKIVLRDHPTNYEQGTTCIDDFGFTPIGAPGTGTTTTPVTPEVPAIAAPEITTQPVSQSVTSGHTATLSVEATGDDLTYQWYGGSSPDVNWPVEGATESTMTTGALGAGVSFWVQVTNEGGTADSDTAAITVTVPLVLSGSGSIAGEDIAHPNGNVFDQILLTGESIKLQAKPGQITRVSFMDEEEDIVQVEYSGAGAFTVTLDSSTFLAAKAPPRYNQSGVAYVTGKPSVVIEGADATTYFSIFTVGKINAVNQALFPEGQEYDAQANVSLVQVINSTGMGGMQLSNAVFSGSTGNIGIDARGVPIAVRLTVGDIDASGDAVPHLLFGSGSFTVAAGNPGLRITGGDLVQTNAASVVVAESGSTTTGFETLISQNNFKSDNTAQPTLSVDATFANEDGDAISVTTEELTID